MLQVLPTSKSSIIPLQDPSLNKWSPWAELFHKQQNDIWGCSVCHLVTSMDNHSSFYTYFVPNKWENAYINLFKYIIWTRRYISFEWSGMRLHFFFPWHSCFCFQNLCNSLAVRAKSCAIITPRNRGYFCKSKSCREGLKDIKISTYSFLRCWAGTQENKPTNQKHFSMGWGKEAPIKPQYNKLSSAPTYCKPDNNHISTMIAAYFAPQTMLTDLLHAT